jgi:dTDP-4-amino-4,6-dideoxygalactose transaminase
MKKVPFVNYGLQYKKIKKEVDKEMQRVLSSGDLIIRKDVEDFEKKLARLTGAKYAISLNSGTDALFLALKALNIGEGDEVITVSHTFVASIATITQAGAKPVLVDVKDDFMIDEEKLEKAITKKTKAIIPVYLNGRMCKMDKIINIAKKHNLFIIEDSAQALGASYGKMKAGSIMGAFSFYPAKILGCFGDGGALTTNSKKIADIVTALRDHGQKTKKDILFYGWNSRLDNLQAAALNVKIKYLPKWLKRRREIASIYDAGLKNIKGIILPPAPGERPNYDVFQNYVLRAGKRNSLFNFLKEKGVETLIKDPKPTHFHKGLNLRRFKLPLTERLAKEVISLPMYPELENSQVDYVIEKVKEFYRK